MPTVEAYYAALGSLPPFDGCVSCTWGGLVFEDGRRRCHRHRSEADRSLIAELDARGRKVGLPRGGDYTGELTYPYGARTYVEMRVRLLAWAEAHDLRFADRSHACISWVSGARCPGVSRCTGLSTAILRYLDHSSSFTGPAGLRLIAAQPYALTTDDAADLHAVVETEGLHLVVQPPGASWYGAGTVMVLIAGFPTATKAAA